MKTRYGHIIPYKLDPLMKIKKQDYVIVEFRIAGREMKQRLTKEEFERYFTNGTQTKEENHHRM